MRLSHAWWIVLDGFELTFPALVTWLGVDLRRWCRSSPSRTSRRDQIGAWLSPHSKLSAGSPLHRVIEEGTDKMVTIGVDPHRQTHTGVAVTALGVQLSQRQVVARRDGFGHRLEWGRRIEQERVWVIEDVRHVSAA